MRWALVAAIVVATTLADVFQSMGMKRHGEVDDFRPGAIRGTLARMARNGYLAVAVLLMAASFFSFVTLLSMADLSFAVPATAGSYVLETLLARLVLKERVNWKRWTGAGMVACGVALLAL